MYNVSLKNNTSVGNGNNVELTYPTDFDTFIPALSFLNPGINTVTVSMTWTGGAGDPVTANNVSSTTNLTVFTPKTASLSESASAICEGGTVTYTILLGGDGTPVSTATYTFRLNGGVVQQIMGTNVFAFAPGTIANGDKVTIDVIDDQNCIVNTSSISKTITVNSSTPATLVSNSTPSLTVCENQSVIFTAGPTGSGESYEFKVGGGPASGVGNILTVGAITGHTSITVKVTNSNGCTSSKTIFVEVPLLASAGSVNPGGIDFTVCPGTALPNIPNLSAATLKTSGVPFGSPGQVLSYQWQVKTSGGAWQNIVGATTAGYVAAATPVFIDFSTEVRRLAFAGINSVLCPSGGDPASSSTALSFTTTNAVLP